MKSKIISITGSYRDIESVKRAEKLKTRYENRGFTMFSQTHNAVTDNFCFLYRNY